MAHLAWTAKVQQHAKDTAWRAIRKKLQANLRFFVFYCYICKTIGKLKEISLLHSMN